MMRRAAAFRVDWNAAARLHFNGYDDARNLRDCLRTRQR